MTVALVDAAAFRNASWADATGLRLEISVGLKLQTERFQLKALT